MTYSAKEARTLLAQAQALSPTKTAGLSSRVYIGTDMVLKTFKKKEHAKDAYKAQAYAASWDAAPKVYGKIKEIKVRTGRIIYGFLCQKVHISDGPVPYSHILNLRFDMLNLFAEQKGKMNLSFLGDIHKKNVGYDDDMGMVLIDFHANTGKSAPLFCSEGSYRANLQERKKFKKEWMA